MHVYFFEGDIILLIVLLPSAVVDGQHLLFELGK